jgi:hypothetical protein
MFRGLFTDRKPNVERRLNEFTAVPRDVPYWMLPSRTFAQPLDVRSDLAQFVLKLGDFARIVRLAPGAGQLPLKILLPLPQYL